MAGQTTLTHAGSGILLVSTTIENGGSLLTIAGNGFVSLEGQISGTGGITTNTDFRMRAAGGANSFSGVTTINSGTLWVEADGQLGSPAGGTVVNSGGTLLFNCGLSYTDLEPLNLNGGEVNASNGLSTFAGPISSQRHQHDFHSSRRWRSESDRPDHWCRRFTKIRR